MPQSSGAATYYPNHLILTRSIPARPAFALLQATAWADNLGSHGGNAKNLTNIDPVTRAILRGFLSTSNLKDVNNVNVRSVAQSIECRVGLSRTDSSVRPGCPYNFLKLRPH